MCTSDAARCMQAELSMMTHDCGQCCFARFASMLGNIAHLQLHVCNTPITCIRLACAA